MHGRDESIDFFASCICSSTPSKCRSMCTRFVKTNIVISCDYNFVHVRNVSQPLESRLQFLFSAVLSQIASMYEKICHGPVVWEFRVHRMRVGYCHD